MQTSLAGDVKVKTQFSLEISEATDPASASKE
jgi:hypothetical protein